MDTKTFKDSVLTVLSRQNLSLSGVEKMHNVSETQIFCIANGNGVVISGNNLAVQKLDVDNGILELSGTVDSIKFTTQKEKGNFFKRIFK